jgi:tRNA dimethylallyltransferase
MTSVLAILGPTAAGKSVLAADVAERRGDVEIVAVDAFTVYRGMDIGTAKPTPEERGAAPHHMIDVLEPEDAVSVQWFQQEARAAIREIHDRGRLPLLVGGSGLYFRAVVDDLRFPPTDPVVRARLESEHAADPAAAHRILAGVDPAAAAKIDPNNLRRTVRALEVIELTEQPFSSYSDTWADFRSLWDLHAVWLQPLDLADRIQDRTAAMLADGLLDEAADLHERELSRTAQQAIGYAECFAVLDDRAERDDLAAAIEQRTRRYARRQASWFKRDERLDSLDPIEASHSLERVRA